MTGKPTPRAIAAASSVSRGSAALAGITGTPASTASARAATLLPKPPHRRARRTDEDDAGRTDGVGELGILRKEAVAGMDRVDPGVERDPDDVRDVEIGLHGRGALTDEIALVGFEAVQGEAVLARVNRDRLELEFGRRPQDADRDFPAIGDEESTDARTRHIESDWVRPRRRPAADRRSAAVASRVLPSRRS